MYSIFTYRRTVKYSAILIGYDKVYHGDENQEEVLRGTKEGFEKDNPLGSGQNLGPLLQGI